MQDVRFHFIADGAENASKEEARLAAAILSDCLSRQGYSTASDDHTVSVTVPSLEEDEATQIFVVLEERLLTHPDLLTRMDGSSAAVVCSARPASVLASELGRFTAGLASVDASGIAMEEGSDPVLAMLGAAARMVKFIDPEALCHSIWSTYDRTYAYAARAAVRVFDLGYMQAQQAMGS